MKKNVILLICLLLFFTASPAVAEPVAVFESPVYTFESVPEGTRIDHDFIVKNTGDSDLNIENVLPP